MNIAYLETKQTDKAVIEAINEQKDKTLKKYKYDYGRFIKYCKERSRTIDFQSVLAYMHHTITEEKLKRSTFDRRIAAIKKCLKTEYNLDALPDELNSISMLRKMYNSEDYKAKREMIGEAAKNKNEVLHQIYGLTIRVKENDRMVEKRDVRMIAIALVNLVTANRPSEMVRLKISDFDLANRLVTVDMVKQERTKQKRLTPEAVDAIKIYINAYKLKEDDYFVTRVQKGETVLRGERMSETGYAKTMRKKLGFVPYTLRKTQITAMHQNGADLTRIAKQSGHQSISTIQKHYIDVDLTELDRFI